MNITIMNQIAELQARISYVQAYAGIEMIIGVAICVICAIIAFRVYVYARDEDDCAYVLVVIPLSILIIGLGVIIGAWTSINIDVPIMQTQLEQLKEIAEMSV